MRSLIKLTDDLALGSSKDSWNLYKPTKVTEKNPSGWRSFKYYTTFGKAAEGAAQMLLRTSRYSSADELTRNADEISRLLRMKLDPQGETNG